MSGQDTACCVRFTAEHVKGVGQQGGGEEGGRAERGEGGQGDKEEGLGMNV